MDMEVETSEWICVVAVVSHLLMAPGTKVEESFNVQATHDLIYQPLNYSQYDHHTFPGVVPRTFVGPLALASVGLPLRALFHYFELSKLWMLFSIRIVLGLTVTLAFLNFARCVKKHFGAETALIFRLIAASQFHFFFYASRPLPNTFALVGVLLLYTFWLDGRFMQAVAVATSLLVVFRCELILLYAPIFLPLLLTGKLPFWKAIKTGLISVFISLALTVPIDSFFWGRWVWPEGEVAWFNIFLNRSHEYGISPWHWYVTSALPRALAASFVLHPLGAVLDSRIRRMVLPLWSFVVLFSLLPHKELRFIIYSVPIFNLAAAAFGARLYINRGKSWLRWVLAYGFLAHILINFAFTVLVLSASARNYPGYDALGYLQWQQRYDARKPVRVHIDVYSAQNGISRFVQLHDAWIYDKTEDESPSFLASFDFVFVGTPNGDLRERIAIYNATHRPLFVAPGFSGIRYPKPKDFPWLWPEVKMKERIAVLKNRDN